MIFANAFSRASAVAFLLVGGSCPAWAQPAIPNADSAAPGTAAKPAHAADGLVFAINSIHADGQRLSISYAIQNTTKFRKYILLYGSTRVSTDDGEFGRVIDDRVVGITHCTMYNGNFDDNTVLSRCRDGDAKKLDNYTYVEPGDVVSAGIAYSLDRQQPKSVSFKFMALVRTASANMDELADAAAERAVGPAHVINVNFPFVPLNGE
jgi:hypothetical protein